MKKVLIMFDSRTGKTKRMAEKIAEGIRSEGHEVQVRELFEMHGSDDLAGYDGYLCGAPTYFKDTTEAMKAFLFQAREANLQGKIGGAFGSYTHIGNGPKMIYDTMEHIFGMNMAGIHPFNVKEQILNSGKGDQPCLDYGKAIAEKL